MKAISKKIVTWRLQRENGHCTEWEWEGRKKTTDSRGNCGGWNYFLPCA